ncbi:hypothetical protein J6590_048290 [Homalodisca vitripennis]|nr:hypothetical protein J6590_048290 [Homalodisca vitripennis]
MRSQGSTMIGAMPAVAVRHERRRQEKRNKRPSLLYLQSPPSRSPTPSPLQSPPSVPCSQPPPEVYVCGKMRGSSNPLSSLGSGQTVGYILLGLFQTERIRIIKDMTD